MNRILNLSLWFGTKENLLSNKIEILYYYSFLILAFFLPLSKAIISLISVFVLLLWLYERHFKSKLKAIKSSNILLVLLIFLLFSYLSFIWSDNVDLKLITHTDYKYLFLIPIFYTAIKKKWIENIITFFLFGMFVSEMVSYGIYFNFWTTHYGTSVDPTPFMNHIQYSVFLSFSAILLLSRLVSKRYTRKEKIFISPFFLTVIINLFLTGGRTGQVAFFLTLFVMFIIHYRLTLKTFILTFVTMGFIFILAYQGSTTFKNRFNKMLDSTKASFVENNYTTSVGIRLSYYILVYDIMIDNPSKLIGGVGKGDASQAISTILKQNEKYKQYRMAKSFITTHRLHNQYLQILLETGLIGLISFTYIFYLLLISLKSNDELSEVVVLFISIYGVSMIFDTVLYTQFTRSLFILFMSMFIVYVRDIPTLKKA
jgi:O-antigen ligase